MARVKVCPNPDCGYRNSPGEPRCTECGYPVANVLVTDDAPVAEPPPDEPIGNRGPAGASVPAPGNALVEEPREKPPETTLETPIGPRATLVFEWGEVAVTNRDPVRVGRDPEFSPHADHITDNEFVSRRHAEVFMRDGRIYVRHMSTTNPTYHNGDPIATPGTEAQLFDEDEVGFSQHLTAKVRLG